MENKLHYSSYLICHEKIQEVRLFLSQFFVEAQGQYNHDNWISFKIPDASFSVNLMKGLDQPMTQNMVFEVSCDSLEKLKLFAKKHYVEIDSFIATETKHPYTYYYIQIPGPENIVKLEISYIEK